MMNPNFALPVLLLVLVVGLAPAPVPRLAAAAALAVALHVAAWTGQGEVELCRNIIILVTDLISN